MIRAAVSAASQRVAIVGVGGIGGSLAGRLIEASPPALESLVAVSHNAAVREAIARSGYRLRGEGGERSVPGTVLAALPDEAFDWILLCTRPPQATEAALAALPHLAPGGALVVCPNGLCEDRVAAVAGAARTVGAIVAFGASAPEPGVFEQTSAGGLTLGEHGDGGPDRLQGLAAVLNSALPASITPNLAGARWSKLAINCAISALGTIGGDRLGPLMTHRFVRRLALEIMTEVVAVARAEGVALEPVSGTLDLDWLALTADERSGGPALVLKHSMLLAVGMRYRKLRSSMLRAIEGGRDPGVQFLNGEIVQRGAAHGIATPFNAEAARLVEAIAAGAEAPSVDQVRRFWTDSP